MASQRPSLNEGEMESRTPSIIDLNAELAKLTMLRGRTPQSTMADRNGRQRDQANPASTSWLFRAFGDASCTGTLR